MSTLKVGEIKHENFTGTTQLKLDNSGRLLLGTTTEGVSTGDTFTIATSSNTGMTLRSGTSNEGNIFFSDGTSGADEYRGSIQYNHGSNFLTIGTDGSERLRIDSSGKVGIGTTSPANKLHLNESTSGSNYIHFTNSGTGTSASDGSQVGLDGNENLILWQAENLPMRFATNNAERMRIDSSGNVGIGDTSPDRELVVKNASSNATVKIEASNAHTSQLFFSDTDAEGVAKIAVFHGSGAGQNALNFETGGSSRLLIDSSGNVGIGTTSPGAKLQVNDTNPVIAEFYHSDGGTNDEARISLGAYSSNPPSQRGVNLIALNNGAGHDFLVNTSSSHSAGPSEKMRVTSSGTLAQTTGDTVYTASVAGAIRMQLVHTGGGNVTWSNPSSGSATYSTSSDYRLKQNVVDLPNAWSTVKVLKPYEYKWKHDTSRTSQGFFAHEVIATVPNSEAGQGTKDAVDEDDKPIYQQIDYSKLVPVLTKALQEAIAKIETLETKVVALEAA